MCKVHNKYAYTAPVGAVYIGRPGKWGNPFVVGSKYNRTEAVAAHREWLMSQPHLIEQVRQELKGKDLICYCAPRACHGDILIKIANEGEIR